MKNILYLAYELSNNNTRTFTQAQSSCFCNFKLPEISQPSFNQH